MINIIKRTTARAACTAIVSVYCAVFLANLLVHKTPIYDPIDF